MKILAIETSCDDTAIAILEVKGAKNPSFKVLSSVVSSQQIHANYGGVFPMMAKREHQKNLVPVLVKSLQDADMLENKPQEFSEKQINTLQEILAKEHTLFESVIEFLQNHPKPNVDYIAITHGPGLEPCLWVGVNFAKALSYVWGLPVIPVNHIEGHILVNFLDLPHRQAGNKEIIFPALSLVVSGGHTQLILVKKIGKYEIVGETRDDAAGECFDKAARILHLGYPGGPIISKIAAEIKESSITLPRPMIYSKDYNFSFSGLKTAVLYKLRDTNEKIKTSPKFTQEMCFAVQEAICDVLIKKTIAAAKTYKVKTIILGGGVSANQELRTQFTKIAKQENINIIFPDPKLSTDNALMIAITGYFNKTKKTSWKKLKVNSNLRIN